MIKRRLPEGFEDHGPDRGERVERLAASLNTLFARWGYRRVEPPALEYLDTLRAGRPGFAEERIYRFLDRQGRLLALRPDMTTGIARMVAGRIPQATPPGGPPLRLRYAGPVFRPAEPGTGRPHSFQQGGVELIGDGRVDADAEVIALARAAVAAIGLEGATLVLGHVDLARGALAAAAQTAEAAEASEADPAEADSAAQVGAPPTSRPGDLGSAFRDALRRRDMVSLAKLLGAELAELFLAGPYAGKDAAAVLAGLAAYSGELARGAAALAGLTAALADHGGPPPLIDPALLRDIDYYSGMVFEILLPGQREAVAGGGRYDGLLAQFGAELPATGFAVNASLAAEALAARCAGDVPAAAEAIVVAWSAAGARPGALACARRLRAGGATVETLWVVESVEAAVAAAAERSAGRLIYFDGDGYREIRLRAGLATGGPAGDRAATQAAASPGAAWPGIGIH